MVASKKLIWEVMFGRGRVDRWWQARQAWEAMFRIRLGSQLVVSKDQAQEASAAR